MSEGHKKKTTEKGCPLTRSGTIWAKQLIKERLLLLSDIALLMEQECDLLREVKRRLHTKESYDFLYFLPGGTFWAIAQGGRAQTYYRRLNWGDRNLSSRNMRSLEFVGQGVGKQSYKEKALAICLGVPLSLLLNTELKMRLHVARLRTPWKM